MIMLNSWFGNSLMLPMAIVPAWVGPTLVVILSVRAFLCQLGLVQSLLTFAKFFVSSQHVLEAGHSLPSPSFHIMPCHVSPCGLLAAH